MVTYVITFDELLEVVRKIHYTSYQAKIVKRKWVLTFTTKQGTPQYRLGESLSRLQQQLLLDVLDMYKIEYQAYAQ